ncbi:exonuclease 1-like [Montipora capricornis]|uniref:exonuclease 1-like n=1 Tax=Montipora foliosa TaxID=591990 RepID=UPI0035F132A0
MSHKLLKVLRDKNMDCIVAPFEADAQLAYLNKNQLIDVVLSEDSDLLVFGCSEFFSRLPQVLGVKSLHVPGPEYLLRFDEADQMFLHQVVFDPRNLRAVPLNPILDESEAPPELQLLVNENDLLDICLGNTDTDTIAAVTLKPFCPWGRDSIWGSRTLLHLECDDESDDTVEDPDYVQPDLHKDSCSSIRTRSQHEQIASRDAIVTEVDQNPISWVVPSFPVMT